MAIDDKTQSPAPAPAADTPAPQAEPTNLEEAQALFDTIVAETEASEGRGAAPSPAPSPLDGEEGATPAPPAATSAPADAPAATPAPSAAPAVSREAALSALGLTAADVDMLRQLPNALKTMGGRVAQMQGELAKMGKTVAGQQQGGDGPSDRQIDNAAKSPEAWEKLVKDFPEWGAAIEARLSTMPKGGQEIDLAAMRKEIKEELKAELQQETIAERQQREAKAAEEANDRAITEKRPEWKQEINSPEFIAWFQKQTPERQNYIQRVKAPTDVLSVLNEWKPAQQKTVDTGVAPAQQSAQAPAAHAAAPSSAPDDLAAAVTPRGTRGTPRKSVEDMTDKEAWEFYASQS